MTIDVRLEEFLFKHTVPGKREFGESIIWAKNDDALDVALYAQYLDPDAIQMLAFTNPADVKYNRRRELFDSEKERLTLETHANNGSLRSTNAMNNLFEPNNAPLNSRRTQSALVNQSQMNDDDPKVQPTLRMSTISAND